jgi:hypothetical protein
MEEKFIQLQIDNLKDDFDEMKVENKIRNDELVSGRESRIRTEIELGHINARLDETHAVMIQLRDAPFIEWKKIHSFWRVAIIGSVVGFVVPWIIGNFVTFLRVFGG